MSSHAQHHSNGRSQSEREQRDANRLAAHVAECIERAQDMLGRLGRRDVYERNYTTEKLADAARCCVDTLALLDDTEANVERLTTRAWESSHTRLQALRRNARQRVEMADGLALRALRRAPRRDAGRRHRRRRPAQAGV